MLSVLVKHMLQFSNEFPPYASSQKSRVLCMHIHTRKIPYHSTVVLYSRDHGGSSSSSHPKTFFPQERWTALA